MTENRFHVIYARRWLIPCALALVTAAAFAGVLKNPFVNWDDSWNLVDNLNYRGLGWAQLRWMFTTSLLGHWIPVTWMTFGLDYLLWGMNPAGYHLTSLLLPIANVVTFYFVRSAPARGGPSRPEDRRRAATRRGRRGTTLRGASAPGGVGGLGHGATGCALRLLLPAGSPLLSSRLAGGGRG
jgi:hypothetical protein